MSGRRLIAVLVLVSFGVGGLRVDGSGASVTRPGFAAPSTPPLPPTYLPTPIGQPPGPPTSTPLAGSGATATPPASATATTTLQITFSLDAVRVSRAHNPGDMTGLAAAVPGSTVWAMIYYTIGSLPWNTTKHSIYEIDYQGRSVVSVSFSEKLKARTTGRFSRYWEYHIPSNLPYGQYLLKARLKIGKQTRSKTWKFSLAKHERLATTSRQSGEGFSRPLNERTVKSG